MKIDGYQIIREISRGPITTVYLANQTALDRQVFLKVLNVQLKHEPDLLERFKREAKICARLKHPNIVSVFDFGATGESFYICMEHIEGQSLVEILRQYQPLPFSVVVFIFTEITRGLAYAHRYGIVHRDVKPANIMVETDGTVKITDFGLATQADLPTVTAQQSAVGTPAYMSPEQAAGKDLDARSDLFSLGATAYELCTGRSPFLGENLADTINNVFHHTPPLLHTIRSDVPPWFSELVQRLLEKNPDKRIQTADEILEIPELKQAIPDKRIFKSFLEHPESFAEQAARPAKPTKPIRKKNAAKTTSISVFIVLLILMAIFLWRQKSVNGHRQLPPPVLAVADSTKAKDTLTAGVRPAVQPRQEALVQLPSKKKEKQAAANKTVVKTGEDSDRTGEAASAMGQLMVICSPWARVYVDSQYVETTPLSAPLELTAGAHLVELKNPGFLPFRRSMVINAKQTDTLKVKLDPAVGLIKVQVVPWADVYLDGRFIGTSPLEKPISASAGDHVLKLVNPGFPVHRDTVMVSAGELIEKKVHLSK